MLSQNDLERIRDKKQRGLITLEEANIEMVTCQRFILVTKLPREIRNFYNNGVKRGELGHLKKEGLKPEVYFHPSFDYLARAERNRCEENSKNILKKIFR